MDHPSLYFVANSILLGAGLAMDAFSVSMANGLAEPLMRRKKRCLMAGTYAGFQFLMPMIGWICVHTIVEHFKSIHIFIPWIALILLLYIGGKMLLEGLKSGAEGESVSSLDVKTLIIQGIATSIDALSVGFTIADYDLSMALLASVLIAAVTFVICIAGVHIGKKFGTRLSGKASILGGCILIGIGLEIFIKGMFF